MNSANEHLAKITGALFSDGCLYKGEKSHYYEVSFSVGTQADVDELTKDLTERGVIPRVRRQEKTVCIGQRTFTIRVFQVRCASKELFLTFSRLGVPVGKKSNVSFSVPDWILNGNSEVKRAFLAGFLGGDGPKVTIEVRSRKGKEPFNAVRINDIEFYKREDLLANGFHFANELSRLLKEQGIVVSRIFNKGRFLRKDGTFSTSIHIALGKSIESALSYSRIGFAYCSQKREQVKGAEAFLETIAQKRYEWKRTYEAALNLYNAGGTVKLVAEKLKISYGTAFGWLRKGKTPTVAYHKLKFDKWGGKNVDD
ncbi:hypothetical protein C4580_02135 [Candidatus Woesearchaeota archaeon]|nr:MAG: hypothetical protein C4580_02135 [Candidatus Woesearchaeota archaeon]